MNRLVTFLALTTLTGVHAQRPPQNLTGISICTLYAFGYTTEARAYIPDVRAFQSRAGSSLGATLRAAGIPATLPADNRCPPGPKWVQLVVNVSVTRPGANNPDVRTVVTQLSLRDFNQPGYPQGVTLWFDKVFGQQRTPNGLDVRLRDNVIILAQSLIRAWRAANASSAPESP